MKFIPYSILSVLLLAVFPSPAADRDLPEELSVLERFVGTWDHVVTLRHPGGGRDSIQKTESTRSWSSGGSFLRFEDVNRARPEFDEFQMLLTYDVLEKIYTGVILDGTDLSKVTATWDEKSTSMTFDAKGDGGNLKYTIRFVTEDKAEGSGTFSDPEGKVIAEITWQQNRRAEPEKKKE